MFSNSARDSSEKNTFRHSLGTGLMSQALDGNEFSALAAKLAGYGWEAFGASNLGNAKYRNDTLHDLNTNAIGAKTASNVNSEARLIEVLADMARNSRQQSLPSVFEATPGYMTRTVK